MPARSLGELARLVGGDLEGDSSLEIRGFASLESAGAGRPVLRRRRAAPRRRAAERGCRADRATRARPRRPAGDPGRPAVRGDRRSRFRVFFPQPVVAPGVHPTAYVADSARISPSATVGAFTVVGERSVVDDRAVLHPHVFVGPDCRVGEGSVLHPHVVLRERVALGRRVIVHPGSVLGADGFGYVFDGQAHRKIPQVGRVVVEDDVEIGANVTVDRATLGETVIGRGTKIDNLVQIGHNTVVGRGRDHRRAGGHRGVVPHRARRGARRTGRHRRPRHGRRRRPDRLPGRRSSRRAGGRRDDRHSGHGGGRRDCARWRRSAVFRRS